MYAEQCSIRLHDINIFRFPCRSESSLLVFIIISSYTWENVSLKIPCPKIPEYENNFFQRRVNIWLGLTPRCFRPFISQIQQVLFLAPMHFQRDHWPGSGVCWTKVFNSSARYQHFRFPCLFPTSSLLVFIIISSYTWENASLKISCPKISEYEYNFFQKSIFGFFFL